MSTKVGIIGCGDHGRLAIQSLQGLGAEIVALCDVDVKRMNEAAALVIRTVEPLRFLHYQELVEHSEVRLVVVGTPDHLHLLPAKAALEAGKYCFVEKPLATTIEEVALFASLAERHSGKLLFDEKWLYQYPMQALQNYRHQLGDFITGFTVYDQSFSERIMGKGKWRCSIPYNPCAGGLGHNLMVATVIVESPIKLVSARGRIATWSELKGTGGFDTMEGVVQFQNGASMVWLVCVGVQKRNAPFGHRAGGHLFQFQNGSYMTGPVTASDQLVVAEEVIRIDQDTAKDEWSDYNIGVMYGHMFEEVVLATGGAFSRSVRRINDGINVAAACSLAFQSAQRGGQWLEIPKEFQL